MPEHRAETPERLSLLESFLWHDFDTGVDGWAGWVRRKLPHMAKPAAPAFEHAMRLHSALRSLQASNNEIQPGDTAAGREALHRLIDQHSIQPRIGGDGQLLLESHDPEDPVASLILMALQAVQSGVWHRFKLCREPTCRASYYDASKACLKTWCSMATCGSRNKMRRYRARS